MVNVKAVPDQVRQVLRVGIGGSRPRPRAWVLKDIEEERQRQALARTAIFIDKHMTAARAFTASDALQAKYSLLDFALGLAPAWGLTVEFGVATGDTLRRIAEKRPDSHGFDSFEGLPEYWRPGYDAGTFAQQQLPEVGSARLHVGWFDDTWPKFLSEHEGNIGFCHFDADLYSSAATIFREAAERFVPGSVLLFDEYFNYPAWEQHEHRAFMELIDRTGHEYEYLAYNALHEQVLVRLTA